MTTEQMSVADHVHSILAGRISERLAQHGAQEINSFISAVQSVQLRQDVVDEHHFGYRHQQTTMLPTSVVKATIRRMRNFNMVRIGRHSRTNLVMITIPNVSASQMQRAVDGFFNGLKNAKAHNEVLRTFGGGSLAKRISYSDPQNTAELGDHMEGAEAGLHTAKITTALEAEQVPSINSEAYDLTPATTLNYREPSQMQIANDTRKARRAAHQAFIATDEGQLWISHQNDLIAAREPFMTEEDAPEQEDLYDSGQDDDVFSVAFDVAS